MNCPECFSINTHVYDTRRVAAYRRRRYACNDCGHRFTTKEMEASRINELEALRAKAMAEKHGKWEPKLMAGRVVCVCSECDTIGREQWKRCPLCETKMDKED